ncbi:MAG: hypothetical protein Q8P31_05060 [Bacillota bacterium]|nr:hypothetical protein [Bacillota bacterium]
MSESDLQALLRITPDKLSAINDVLLDPANEVVSGLLKIVAKYGTPDEINRKAREARRLDNLLSRLDSAGSAYLDDVRWLIQQRDRGAFISVSGFRRKVLGDRAGEMSFAEDRPVTLEISAAQYFPWLRAEAEQAIAGGELMPGRYIRVRKMKEQEADLADIVAFAAAMEVMGASYVETLDTRGTDGANVHLGGPATITGYFGGVGQPNEYPLRWVDELLYYYTTYGVKQVLNVNPGTVLAGYMLYKMGIDLEFKISVFMGNDNPLAALWTLIGAGLFARPDGTSPLIGFNWSNSTDNKTLETAARFREQLGFEDVVRFEHHVVETWRSIVRQPYDRRRELVEVAARVRNISAKHEGGDVEVEQALEARGGHTSDILDYFRDKAEIIASGDWDALTRNYLDKHNAVNRTAWALTESGLAFIAAPRLHHL